jgi:glycosyltransferase involved in cell wall biosynthesis
VTLMLTTPGWRGSGASFVKIATGLSACGHTVRCIAGDPDVAARLTAAGLLVDLVPTGDTGRREVSAVRRLFDHHRAEVVIGDAPRDVRIARYASWPRPRPIVWRYNLHGRRLATDVLQRWLFGGVRHITHLSAYGAARLLADSPWLSGRPSSVIPNGFDLDALQPDPARGAAFRRTHGIAPDGLLIATPTPSLPEKAVPVARAAVARLGERFELTWALADAAEPSADSRLRVLPLGRLDQAALHDLIRAADLVLLPSPAELFGNVTGEAMALGRVVVGADAGATPEVIGDAGILFRAGDADGAARVMTPWIDQPEQRAALGAAARQRIAECFPLERMQAEFDALVRSL